MNAQIRQIIAKNSALPESLIDLPDDANLYAAGLSSHGSVQLMLALEDAFDIEFPDTLLNRKSFSTVAVIEETVNGLIAQRDKA